MCARRTAPAAWCCAGRRNWRARRIDRLVFVERAGALDGERIGKSSSHDPARHEGTRGTASREDAGAACSPLSTRRSRAGALERYTPHPIAAMKNRSSSKSLWVPEWPATVIRCARSANPPEAHQRRNRREAQRQIPRDSTRPLPRCLTDPDGWRHMLMSA